MADFDIESIEGKALFRYGKGAEDVGKSTFPLN
jgi:hypothetical protein